MLNTNDTTPTIYLTLDCEFTDQGLVRELVLLLYKNQQIVRALEVFISPSGTNFVRYNTQQLNYHLSNPKLLNICIDRFLKSCVAYTELENIRIVGMGLEGDMKALLKTTGKPSLLNTLFQKTQLEMCGRGTLETKSKTHGISDAQIKKVLAKLVTINHVRKYKYHTALYDAVATGYVYLRVTGQTDLMSVHSRFKHCTHTYFEGYYEDTSSQTRKENTPSIPEKSDTKKEAPKSFPDLHYKVQKNISNVFDIVPRHIFYKQFSILKYEPSIKRSYDMKAVIMKDVHVAKEAVRAYDTNQYITDPYNITLVHAGELLVLKKITPEEFIDFAIYMQQYNLPKNKGTYFKVWNQKKELFVRCLNPSTAKKLLSKRAYCTMEQFLRKEVPDCHIEILD